MKKFSSGFYSIFTRKRDKALCPVYFLTGTNGTTLHFVCELKKACKIKAYGRRDKRDKGGTSLPCPGRGAKRRDRDRRDNTPLGVVPMFRPVAEIFPKPKKHVDVSATTMPVSAP